MWRSMVLVRTEVSEERIASIFRVRRISKVETTPAVTFQKTKFFMLSVFASTLLFANALGSYGLVDPCKWSPPSTRFSLLLVLTVCSLSSSHSFPSFARSLLLFPFLQLSPHPSSFISLRTVASVFTRFPSVSSSIIFHCFRFTRNSLPSRF
jgi:hypothetical protein